MNIKLIVLALLTTTLIGIAVFPTIKQANAVTTQQNTNLEISRPSIEVVFVLDTTSSMSGLIQAAKEKIWSIASTMASAQQNPDIKMGLVAFRDRGDAYVTKILQLSNDLDSMYAELMDFRAQGGGDGPESVNQALDDAINRISWSSDNDTYRVAFLIGDAPPHMDYPDDTKFPVILQQARQKGIVVNTIQSGQQRNTTPVWQNIAQLGYGEFFQVESSGNAVAVSTPFDKKLSALAASLEDTRIFYGGAAQHKLQQRKIDASKKLHTALSEAAKARRSIFNASTSGEANLLGENELVDAISSGRLEFDDIATDELPASLQAMTAAEQKQLIETQTRRRAEIKKEITELSASRNKYIADQVGTDAASLSLDEKIYSAVKKQGKSKGLIYNNDRAEY